MWMPIPLSAKQDGGNLYRALGRNLLDPSAPTNPVPADLFRGQSGDHPSTAQMLNGAWIRNLAADPNVKRFGD